ncbi:hypothetical protein DICVIV_05919 [Dictyocaulus viviparus]|uniref:Uncharacterized protein n=1 Tax=Dictyocaulus viviparus TaxID=29172 RepID=A0A0D8XW23_DICVI|nr:hypothetical protein DICVIV_05919 [Dictyocaulus viviparus]
MSLKEFTGLDNTKEEVSNLPTATWKSFTSPSSLINSFSARRRSVLSSDVPSSPSKKLAPPQEECIDISTAIKRISALRIRLDEIRTVEKLSTASSSFVAASSSQDRRQQLLEESKRIVNAAKDFASISCSSSDAKWNATVAEIVDCADCLTSAALAVLSESNVYYSQLITTELIQTLTAIHSSLNDAQQSRLNNDDNLMSKSMVNLQSAVNQLMYAITSSSSTT